MDIVEKLQRLSGYLAAAGEDEGFPVCDEAADEIERLREALRVADDAIAEMFRYYDGGETRGSYDGKPERNQLRKAGYTTRAALKGQS